MQGRQSGAFIRYQDGELDQAIPPTGRRIDVEQIHLLTLRDGQVVDHQAVRDDVTMLGQLGVFPPTLALGLRMVGWKITGKAGRATKRTAAVAAAAAANSQA